MALLSSCLQCKVSTNLWIDQSFWWFQQIKFDTLNCAELVRPESGQCPTTQIKDKFDCLELSICHDIFIFMLTMQDEYKLVDLTVFLTISTNQILHFVLWWTGETLEWPVPYITDEGQFWLFGIVNWRLWKCSKHQTCWTTSLVNIISIHQNWHFVLWWTGETLKCPVP